MFLYPALICFPFLIALILPVIKNDKVRGGFVYSAAIINIILGISAVVFWAMCKAQPIELYVQTELIDKLMLAGEFLLMALIIVLCVKYKKYPIMLLSIAQTLLIAWQEIFNKSEDENANICHIYIDRLSILMILIVTIIGSLICIYAVGYMRGYHNHHKEFKDRRSFFFPLLFAFLGAMSGLVMSQNLVWMYFFWEITSVISFLLIGYTKTPEAITNCFRALWMNLLGGLGMCIGIVLLQTQYHVFTFNELLSSSAFAQSSLAFQLPIALLAFAGLTKSAQLPFSNWLLGAMVAPTPSSALLHSATMVKAGVYLLIRIAPAMSGTETGWMISFVGGFTFLMASMLAVSQSDGKKVLAYSTISNLGLITACAGIGTAEAVCAGVLLMIFHAVSKSMLFQAVGAVENSLGSRDIEDMHGLIIKLPKLACVISVGIVGMYLAPFGMLISKWAALKAFFDSSSINSVSAAIAALLLLFLAFGSGTTMFYWTKWLCKILPRYNVKEKIKDVTLKTEYVSLFIHSAMVLLLCFLLPIIIKIFMEPMMQELYNTTQTVLTTNNFVVLNVMLCVVFIVPIIMYFVSMNVEKKVTISYMSGINEGDNENFVDSFGEPKKVELSNWYLQSWFGENKLMKLSIVISTIVISAAIVFILIGGAI